MTRLDRRSVLTTGMMSGFWLMSGCTLAAPPRPFTEQRTRFAEGVASGDPTHDSVILWTRYTPSAVQPSAELVVELAEDADFRSIVARRRVTVDARLDWTCRVLVNDLRPAQVYWFRFADQFGGGSRVGRTITAPHPDDPRPVAFAFVSCQDLNQSALNAYRRMLFEDRRASRDEQLGFVLHLGDFIYEILWYPEEQAENYGRRIREVTRLTTDEKFRKFHVPVNLEDYRRIYRAYLQDPDLQEARAWLPFVCMWDNHEFSWQGFQSIEIFGGKDKPAQTRKVAANQAWFEFQPARVRTAKGFDLAAFHAPRVDDIEVRNFDDAGLGLEPNNLAAIESLTAYRSLRYGQNIDLMITDTHSYRCRDRGTMNEASPFSLEGFQDLFPEEIMKTLDAGRAANGGQPPDRLRFGPVDAPNFAKDLAPQTVLGIRQKQWFKSALASSTAKWKVWASSNGLIDMRADPQNLPADFSLRWPSQGYACFGGGDPSTAYVERAEILDWVRDKNIGGFTIISGDRHSFWAGTVSKELPPGKFEPVAASFITGSISAPGLVEAVEHVLPKDLAIRPLYLADREKGPPAATINMLLKHGVRSCLDFAKRGDVQKARALSNPLLSPHLSFVDMGGNGYSIVRASDQKFDVEFVCIPRPNERSESEDGGTLRYRTRHIVNYWESGESPLIEQTVVEGDVGLSI